MVKTSMHANGMFWAAYKTPFIIVYGFFVIPPNDTLKRKIIVFAISRGWHVFYAHVS